MKVWEEKPNTMNRTRTSSTKAHRILVETYGEHALSEMTFKDWFRRFLNNDFAFGDKERFLGSARFNLLSAAQTEWE
ncbi:hypothetical protein NPIL_670411 [Nephila pilipes]|uniref:Mos1 transposase HTH domain-containing protein n=1 Tax=Nephila pilipes TaxID=299642 RepID=A0A8X6PG16_NEPPI|nr:hypothetical protein NPIL_670411 [Nephila pilipes]